MSTYAAHLGDISFDVAPTGANPSMANQIEGMSHWMCSLSRGIDIVEFAVSMDDDTAPDVEVALGFLAADLQSVIDHGSFEAWVNGLGIAIDGDLRDDFSIAYNTIVDHVAAIEETFGRHWLDGLVSLAEMAPAHSAGI